MKASELRSKDVADLKQELDELLREQFNLRMQLGSGQLNQNHRVGQVRKNIARVKTIIREKNAGVTNE